MNAILQKKLKGWSHLDSFILQKCAQRVYIDKNQILWLLNCIMSVVSEAKVSMGLSGDFPFSLQSRNSNAITECSITQPWNWFCKMTCHQENTSEFMTSHFVPMYPLFLDCADTLCCSISISTLKVAFSSVGMKGWRVTRSFSFTAPGLTSRPVSLLSNIDVVCWLYLSSTLCITKSLSFFFLKLCGLFNIQALFPVTALPFISSLNCLSAVASLSPFLLLIKLTIFPINKYARNVEHSHIFKEKTIIIKY